MSVKKAARFYLFFRIENKPEEGKSPSRKEDMKSQKVMEVAQNILEIKKLGRQHREFTERLVKWGKEIKALKSNNWSSWETVWNTWEKPYYTPEWDEKLYNLNLTLFEFSHCRLKSLNYYTVTVYMIRSFNLNCNLKLQYLYGTNSNRNGYHVPSSQNFSPNTIIWRHCALWPPL